MSFAGSLQHNEVHIWQVKLNDTVWDGFSAVLCDSEREKALRYRAAALQKRYARCRSALRLILARYLNLCAADLDFHYGEFGKPELINHRLQFNVSHSNDHALIAVSLHNVGIDLEMIDGTKADLSELIDLVCHPEEKSALAQLPDAEQSERFFRLWAQKEAYCKMRGIGLHQSLSALRFSTTANPAVLRVCTERPDQVPQSFVHNLNVLENHAASICMPVADACLVVFQA